MPDWRWFDPTDSLISWNRQHCYQGTGRHRETPVGQSAEFHQTWQALMQQLERVLSLAHQRQPNRTETREAVSIAKHLLGKVGDRLDAATHD